MAILRSAYGLTTVATHRFLGLLEETVTADIGLFISMLAPKDVAAESATGSLSLSLGSNRAKRDCSSVT